MREAVVVASSRTPLAADLVQEFDEMREQVCHLVDRICAAKIRWSDTVTWLSGLPARRSKFLPWSGRCSLIGEYLDTSRRRACRF